MQINETFAEAAPVIAGGNPHEAGRIDRRGNRGLQAPFDAFWGARYAIIEDPDGIAVGLMSPISAKHRAPPPEV